MTSRGALEGSISRFIGLSTDDKPGSLRGDTKLPVGSSFFETDTWRIARYDGTLWRYEAENPILAELQDIKVVLEAIRTRLPEPEPANPFS